MGHVVLFFGWVLLWYWTLDVHFAKKVRILRLVTVAGLAMGVVLEGVQIFLPERGASMLDLGANVLGVVLCWWGLRKRLDIFQFNMSQMANSERR
jgi:VanZ family protein